MPCSSIANKAIGQVCRPAEKKRLEKKLLNLNKNGIDYCKLETCTMSCSFFPAIFSTGWQTCLVHLFTRLLASI